MIVVYFRPCICSLAFFACMRVGEFGWTTMHQVERLSYLTSPTYTPGGRESKGHFSKVTRLLKNKNLFCSQFLTSNIITIRDYFSVVVNRRSNFCPVPIILDYLSLRGSSQGPIFTFQMVSLCHELDLLTSFPWPLSIAVLTLPVIKVIAFALVLPLMLLMLECLTRGLSL